MLYVILKAFDLILIYFHCPFARLGLAGRLRLPERCLASPQPDRHRVRVVLPEMLLQVRDQVGKLSVVIVMKLSVVRDQVMKL